MPTRTLTVRFIDALTPTTRRVEYIDTVARGLALRVTETGNKSWAIRYRTEQGTLKRLTIGTYPDLSLKDARARVDVERGTIAKGHDPAAAKQEARRTAARLGDTIADLAKEYIERHAKPHKRSWAEDQRKLDVDVLPQWRTVKVKALTRRHVRELIRGIADRGAPIAANRVLALVRKMLNYAVAEEWIDANPAALIMKPGAEQSREDVLTDDQLRLVWAATAAEGPAMCALQRLRLVTVQRGGELAKLRWDDLDLTGGWLTFPSTVTKNKRPHRVPLTTLALDIVDTVPRTSDEWVFPGLTGRKPRRDMTRGGQRVGARVLVELQKVDPDATFDFKGHDLRRTASTRMAEAGISQADIAHVLNHSAGGPKVTQVYNRYEYDREKRVALDTWARVLAAILEDKTSSGAVVPFVRSGLK